jgi:ribosomal protein L23
MEDTTTARDRHIRYAAKDLYSVEVTERRILSRESEDVRILRVSRQGQRQGDREPRALKLITLYPG